MDIVKIETDDDFGIDIELYEPPEGGRVIAIKIDKGIVDHIENAAPSAGTKRVSVDDSIVQSAIASLYAYYLNHTSNFIKLANKITCLNKAFAIIQVDKINEAIEALDKRRENENENQRTD